MLESKIKSLRQLKPIVAGLRRKKRRIVFTNGCFDLLHYGHVQYLEKAKAKGDVLIVAVNSDRSVRRLKGRHRPVVSQRWRCRVLAALSSVDYVTVFTEDTPLETIRALAPDVLVKGGDWNTKNIVGADLVLRGKGKVYALPFARGFSTTGLLKKIAQSCCCR